MRLPARLLRTACPTLLAAATALGGPRDWPGFRGADAGGVYAGECAVLQSDAISLAIAWKRPLGSGYSGVAIADGLVVTACSDGADDVVVAFDEESGEQLWVTPLDTTYTGHDGSHNGPIATPCLAGGRVFMLTPRGILAALDARTGAPAWETRLVDQHGASKPHYGFASSPLIADGVLVVHLGAQGGALAGFEPATGKKLWTAGEGVVQYQSPVGGRLPDGRAAVFAASDSTAYALDPRTGEVLWRLTLHTGDDAAAHDPRGSGSLVPVFGGEQRWLLKHSGEASRLVRLNQDGGTLAAAQLWESPAIRNTYSVPVAHGEHLYAFSSRFLTCVDLATGEAVWRSRAPGDGFAALADDHLVLATKDGAVHVARATPRGYEERAALPVFADALIWAPPSVANDRIYVRSHDGLARIDIRPAPAASPADAAPPAPIDQAAAPAGRPDAPPAAGSFAALLAEIPHTADAGPLIDAYLARQESFPVIEDERRVHFIYRGPGQDLALGCESIGARQERRMTRVPGTDLFYFTMELEPDARLNYVFQRDYQDILDPRNPRRATTLAFSPGMEVSFGRKPPFEMSWLAMPRWRPADNLAPPPGGPRGRLETHEIESPALAGKLTLSVYVPAGYNAAGPRYPAIYVVDGQAALERGQLQNVLDHEVGRRVEPVLVVALSSALRGIDPRLSAALARDAVAFIDRQFHTRAEPGGRAIMGAGFHGVFALNTAFQNAGVFGTIAVQSPFAIRSFEEVLGAAIAELPPDYRPRVHLVWGKYDMRNPHEAWDMPEFARATDAGLRAAEFSVTGGEDRLGTDWPSWQHRLGDVLAAIAPHPEPTATRPGG